MKEKGNNNQQQRERTKNIEREIKKLDIKSIKLWGQQTWSSQVKGKIYRFFPIWRFRHTQWRFQTKQKMCKRTENGFFYFFLHFWLPEKVIWQNKIIFIDVHSIIEFSWIFPNIFPRKNQIVRYNFLISCVGVNNK